MTPSNKGPVIFLVVLLFLVVGGVIAILVYEYERRKKAKPTATMTYNSGTGTWSGTFSLVMLSNLGINLYDYTQAPGQNIDAMPIVLQNAVGGKLYSFSMSTIPVGGVDQVSTVNNLAYLVTIPTSFSSMTVASDGWTISFE